MGYGAIYQFSDSIKCVRSSERSERAMPGVVRYVVCQAPAPIGYYHEPGQSGRYVCGMNTQYSRRDWGESRVVLLSRRF